MVIERLVIEIADSGKKTPSGSQCQQSERSSSADSKGGGDVYRFVSGNAGIRFTGNVCRCLGGSVKMRLTGNAGVHFVKSRCCQQQKQSCPAAVQPAAEKNKQRQGQIDAGCFVNRSRANLLPVGLSRIFFEILRRGRSYGSCFYSFAAACHLPLFPCHHPYPLHWPGYAPALPPAVFFSLNSDRIMLPKSRENVTVSECHVSSSMPIFGRNILSPMKIRTIDSACLR